MNGLDALPELAPKVTGQLVKNRYRVVEVEQPTTIPRIYRVSDFYVPGRTFQMREYPVPLVASSAFEHIRRGVDEEHRALSWLQTAGLILPRDLFTEENRVYVVEGAAAGVPLDEHLAAHPPGLGEAARWASAMCDLLRPLHAAHPRPVLLGRLSERNLLLHEGRVQLVGFRLDDGFRLIFETPRGADVWRAPEGTKDARSDVWCLGVLLRRLLAARDEAAAKMPLDARRERSRAALQAIVERATAEDPEGRPESVGRLKTELERAIRQMPARERRIAQPQPFARRYPLATNLLPFATAVLILALLAYGARLVEAAGREQGAGLRSTPIANIPGLPAGTEVWTEGTVVPRFAELVSPLAAAPCVGYSAKLVRRVRREVFDREEKGYRVRTFDTVLLDRTRCQPFVLRQGKVWIKVLPGVPQIEGRPLVLREIPGYLRESGEGFKVPPLRVGEHVIGISGVETRLAAGDTVYIRARVDQENGKTVLKVPEGAPLIIYRGTWTDYFLQLVRALLPGVLMMGLGIILMVFGANRLWKQRKRLAAPK